MTLQCLQSVVRHTEPGTYEIILVDNGSEPAHAALMANWVTANPQARLLRHPNNMQFAHGCNSGAALARGEYLVFLNNDTQVSHNWLPPLLAPISRGKAAACQALLLYPNGQVQSAGTVLSTIGSTGQSVAQGMDRRRIQAIWPRHGLQALSGACIVLKAHQFMQRQGFCPAFINGQEDTDLCQRIAQTGQRLHMVRDAVVKHAESQTPGRSSAATVNRHLYRSRWPFHAIKSPAI
jgi:GT2 family glycosyltransferase